MDENETKAFRKIQISDVQNIPGTVEAITEILMDDDAATEIFAAIDRADLTNSEIDQLIMLLNSKRSKQKPTPMSDYGSCSTKNDIYIKLDYVHAT